jgi:hypothetical protein
MSLSEEIDRYLVPKGGLGETPTTQGLHGATSWVRLTTKVVRICGGRGREVVIIPSSQP